MYSIDRLLDLHSNLIPPQRCDEPVNLLLESLGVAILHEDGGESSEASVGDRPGGGRAVRVTKEGMRTVRAEEGLNDVKPGVRVIGEVVFGMWAGVEEFEARGEGVGWEMGAEVVSVEKKGLRRARQREKPRDVQGSHQGCGVRIK